MPRSGRLLRCLESLIERAGLAGADPGRDRNSRPIGKEKRLRAVFNWALIDDEAAGGRLEAFVIAEVRGCGGFRPGSPNFIGSGVIEDVRTVFAPEGWIVESDGEFRPSLLEHFEGLEARESLRSYIRRIRQGSLDDSLVLGTSKDLLEATAAYVITERYGTYSTHADFRTLLGQAFIVAGFATPAVVVKPNEPVRCALERSLYELGCAVNRLRNKDGAGHGRPFLASITPSQAKAAANAMALISEALLDAVAAGS